MFRFVIFVVVSVGIIYLSWPSLRNPRAHGFFRFFVFETILLLVLLNMDHWFRDPFNPLQIISWLFLLASLLLAIHGFYLLHVVGEPEGGFETTTKLVTRGAYRYIRHPLYASLLLFGLGAFLKDPSFTGCALLTALLAFLISTARVEEAENIRHFGLDYADYIEKTKMFLPFLL